MSAAILVEVVAKTSVVFPSPALSPCVRAAPEMMSGTLMPPS